MAPLDKATLAAIADDLNYLNMGELKQLCRKFGLPSAIHAEMPDGKCKKTGEADRKGIILDRLRRYLETGEVTGPTVFPACLVAGPDAAPIGPDSPVLYGQYKNRDAQILTLMQGLTDGRFNFGAIAQEVLREVWTRGEAPTYRAFAELWLAARNAHQNPNPEWAYLSDRKKDGPDKDWKKRRQDKADRIMALLMD